MNKILIVDEAHHISALQYIYVCKNLTNRNRVIGLSGTPFREDGTGIFDSSISSSDYVISGIINYTTGLIEVNIDTVVAGTEVYIRYQQDEDRNLVVGFKQICKIYSIDWQSVAVETQ